MAFSFILSGTSSELNFDFNPPIYLEDDINYEIGLVNFDSFYSIPNVDETNNTFIWWDEVNQKHTVKIPTGAYEINNLMEVMQRKIINEDDDAVITMSLDINTSKVILRTNRKISFDVENSLCVVLGFNKQIVEAENNTVGNSPVQILKVNAICIDCNLAVGSYLNGRPVHIIHEFFPAVSPGYKIIETPQNTIYYPVTLKRINNVRIRIIDQDGELINFRGEVRTVRLHLRQVK